jgi:hypothetical protein
VEAGKRAGLRHAGLRSGESTSLIRACLRETDRTSLQNILMRMPDKVCAVALAALPAEEREPVYGLVAPQKALRIKEEIRIEALRRTTALVRGRITRAFLSYFGKARSPGGRIWVRPKRDR